MSGGAIGDMWVDYGNPRDVPNDAMMYVLTNEQINFIAAMVRTTNDVFSFQMPYPFYIDQREQAIIFHRIDFIWRTRDFGTLSASVQNRLEINLQYSDKEPAVDYDGIGEDAEDENMQAMFDGPFVIGDNKWSGAADVDATLAVVVPNSNTVCVHYYPPDKDGLDAFFPLTVVFVNQSFDRDLVDQTADIADFSLFERVSIRNYFTVRNLTSREKSLMNDEYYGLVPLS